MAETDKTRQRLRDLFETQRLAVLSNHKDGRASLKMKAGCLFAKAGGRIHPKGRLSC